MERSEEQSVEIPEWKTPLVDAQRERARVSALGEVDVRPPAQRADGLHHDGDDLADVFVGGFHNVAV